MMRSIAALILCTMLARPAQARDWPEWRQVKEGEAIAGRADRAYLLMRLPKSSQGWVGPAWIRIPRADELDAYEAGKRKAFAKAGAKAGDYQTFAFDTGRMNNIYGLDLGKGFANQGTTRTFLVEVEPATYVLAGVANHRAMWQCFCLGTVEVQAKAGVVTDLGTILIERADRPSREPELASVSNLGSMGRMDYQLFAGAIRPVGADSAPVTGIASIPVVAAPYRASAPFVIRSALLPNFLAPFPGVLDYRRGEVFDVKAQVILPAR